VGTVMASAQYSQITVSSKMLPDPSPTLNRRLPDDVTQQPTGLSLLDCSSATVSVMPR